MAKDDSARRERTRRLAEEHLHLVYRLAWEYRDMGLDLQELRQAGALGLCEAARRFKPESHPGAVFEDYAVPDIRKRICQALVREHPIRVPERAYHSGVRPHRVVPLDPAIVAVVEKYDSAVAIELGKLIEDAFGELDPVVQAVLMLRFGLGDIEKHTILETAKQLGIGRGMVAYHTMNGIKSIQRFLSDRGWCEESWAAAIA
jgi:RNA polymerase sigma factor (sigma-70 family)